MVKTENRKRARERLSEMSQDKNKDILVRWRKKGNLRDNRDWGNFGEAA